MPNDEKFKELLKFIDERLQKKHKLDIGLVRKHNADQLNKNWQIPEDTLWEQSDVAHDILAFLAEQMIEMNKQKQSEIKGFLDFLKGEIGALIENLSNKTAIQEYYKHEFQNLIDVLVKNKKKLKAGYDPKSPTSYKHLLEWYNASMDKLKPLMGRIEATDRIIDQIVYKLYGLTDDEIKIVEESLTGKDKGTPKNED